jgi:hypothetical protein
LFLNVKLRKKNNKKKQTYENKWNLTWNFYAMKKYEWGINRECIAKQLKPLMNSLHNYMRKYNLRQQRLIRANYSLDAISFRDVQLVCHMKFKNHFYWKYVENIFCDYVYF